jgi:formylglycine-generating enzyme required for sulfatase activity
MSALPVLAELNEASERLDSPQAAKVQIYAATANAGFAEKIANCLDRAGMEIVTGDFLISGADCVIVVWSGVSISSRRLIEAAKRPLSNGVLVPVSIGRIEPPEGFKHLQPVDLAGWGGDNADPRWQFVLDEIARFAPIPAGGREEVIRKAPPPGGAGVRSASPQDSRRAQTSVYAAPAAFESWFEEPYTEEAGAPRRVAPPAASFVAPAARRRPRRMSLFLLAGVAFGAIGAALFAGIVVPTAIKNRPKGAVLESANIPAPKPQPKPKAEPAPAAPLTETAPDAAPVEAPSATMTAPTDEIAALIAENTGAAPAAVTEASGEPGAANNTPIGAGRPLDSGALPQMLSIPAGAFAMGAGPKDGERRPEESPVVSIRIEKPFALARTETTVAQWNACVADNACKPLSGKAEENKPAVGVSYDDAVGYANWLSQKTGARYRLPSEAEWEYAARAGATTPFSFGATLSAGDASFDGSIPFLGKAGASLKGPQDVARYPANAFGLHDMHGNAWEWTADCWAPSHQGAAADGRARGGECRLRVLKGGAWNSGGHRLRAAHRIGKLPAVREYDNGFRVLREMP